MNLGKYYSPYPDLRGSDLGHYQKSGKEDSNDPELNDEEHSPNETKRSHENRGNSP